MDKKGKGEREGEKPDNTRSSLWKGPHTSLPTYNFSSQSLVRILYPPAKDRHQHTHTHTHTHTSMHMYTYTYIYTYSEA